jgi:hypothetical protein
VEFTASFAAQRTTATSITGRVASCHGRVERIHPEPVRPAPRRPRRITPYLFRSASVAGRPATHSHARQISGGPSTQVRVAHRAAMAPRDAHPDSMSCTG